MARWLGASLLLGPMCASACQVDRGGLTFDDDAFGDFGGAPGDGDGALGGQGGAAPGQLPRTGIHFDNDELDAGEVRAQRGASTLSEFGDAVSVSLPFDPRDPAAQPEATELSLRASCRESIHEVASNPIAMLLYGVDPSIVWPGAFLQGGAFENGSLTPLDVDGSLRTPLDLSLKTNYGETEVELLRVESPHEEAVRGALVDLIDVELDDEVEFSSGQVEASWEATGELSRFFLEQGVSMRLGTPVEALSDGVAQGDEQRTIVVHLMQNLFEVEAHAPASPEEWFTSEFFGDALSSLTDSGDMAEENPPVYVSKVIYGKMLSLVMTSTASLSDMLSVVEPAVSLRLVDESPVWSARQQQILTESQFQVSALGGQDARGVVRSGDWRSFFSEDPRLSTAVPLAVELRNLSDDSPAGVSEEATFEERICTPMMAVDGPFDFGFEEPVSLGDDFEVTEVVAADVNGDGVDDLVWNQRTGSETRVLVTHGGGVRWTAADALCEGDSCAFSGAGIDWTRYRLLTGDFTGDGRDDLLWVPNDASRIQLGLSLHLLPATSDGFAGAPESVEIPLGGETETAHPPLLGDMNGDGLMDIVFHFMSYNGTQIVYHEQVALAEPAGGFTSLPWTLRGEATDDSWVDSPPTTKIQFGIADVNLDGDMDILLSILGHVVDSCGVNRSCRNSLVYWLNSGSSTPEWNIAPSSPFIHSAAGWGPYRTLFGDFDGDLDPDAVFLREVNTGGVGIHLAVNIEGDMVEVASTSWPAETPEEGPLHANHVVAGASMDAFVMSVDGDAAEDVVVSSFLDENWAISGDLLLNAVATLPGVARSDEEGDGERFQRDVPPQVHPVIRDWSPYDRKITADLNGDGRDDLIWIDPASRSAHIAYGKPRELQ